MSLEATLESLGRELARLQEEVSALHVTVTEDKPARDAAVLVDRLDNVVMDLLGMLEEAHARVTDAIQVSNVNGPLEAVRSALRDIHDLVIRLAGLHASELAAHDEISRLLKMGRERGREWREWSQEVKTAIERCEAPMKAAARATLECWDELADRLTRNAVSVQATNIGQQITVREDQLELVGKST